MRKPKTSLAYCAGLDQMVRVFPQWELTGEPKPRNGVAGDPSQLICLDYGDRCTGAVCPLFQVPQDEMELRLVRHGLRQPSAEKDEALR